jgi:hypothetical protein
MLCGVGCNKKNVIPDDTLAEIFHDAFVANAYIEEERINLDSLQVYEPIFERYGYTAKDVIYTVGNFSRRKSARLGTVVEQAISRLEQESKIYAKKVVILDTINNVAVRSFTRTVYQDTLIKATKRADSTALKITISPIYQGEYSISYNYTYEEFVQYPRSAEFYFNDESGYRNTTSTIPLRQSGLISRTLTPRGNQKELVLNLGKYIGRQRTVVRNGKKKVIKVGPPKTQDLEIRNLKVVYKPTLDIAIDSLFERYVNIKIFVDGFLVKKDSLALSADTTRISTPTAPNN